MLMVFKVLLLSAVVCQDQGVEVVEVTPDAALPEAPQHVLGAEIITLEEFLEISDFSDFGSALEANLQEAYKKLYEILKTAGDNGILPSDISAENLQIVTGALEENVRVLHNLDDSARTDEQKAAYEKILELDSQLSNPDEKAENSHLIIERIQVAAYRKLNNQPLEQPAVNRLSELVFKNRRCDQTYNKFLDAEKADSESDDDFASRKASLKEQYEAGYLPSLWPGYQNADNLEKIGAHPDQKRYINIPVNIDVGDAKELKDQLTDVMDEIREKTCINFSQVKDVAKVADDQQYIEFVKSDDPERGCDEIIGMKSTTYARPQTQPFGKACRVGKSTVAHYFMHSLGFDNEHQRPDVKKYMIVHEDMKKAGDKVSEKVPKLKRRSGHNDLKDETDNVSFLAGAYDTMSVMQWSSKYIVNHENTQFQHMRLGENTIFSAQDIEKINKLYKCDAPPIALEEEIDSCLYLINEDGSVDVPADCLYSVEKEKVNGEAHIFVEGKESKKAKIILTYDLEKAGSEVVSQEEVSQEEVVAPEQAAEDIIPGQAAPVVGSRLLNEAAPVAEPVAAPEAAPVVVEVVEPVAAPKASVPVAGEVPEATEPSFLVKLSDWDKEHSLKFDNDGLKEVNHKCNFAKLGYNYSSNFGIVCGSSSAGGDEKEFSGECGEAVKFSYELKTSAIDALKVKNPTLKVDVRYDDCEPQQAALKEENSESSYVGSFLAIYLALF